MDIIAHLGLKHTVFNSAFLPKVNSVTSTVNIHIHLDEISLVSCIYGCTSADFPLLVYFTKTEALAAAEYQSCGLFFLSNMDLNC